MRLCTGSYTVRIARQPEWLREWAPAAFRSHTRVAPPTPLEAPGRPAPGVAACEEGVPPVSVHTGHPWRGLLARHGTAVLGTGGTGSDLNDLNTLLHNPRGSFPVLLLKTLST